MLFVYVPEEIRNFYKLNSFNSSIADENKTEKNIPQAFMDALFSH